MFCSLFYLRRKIKFRNHSLTYFIIDTFSAVLPFLTCFTTILTGCKSFISFPAILLTFFGLTFLCFFSFIFVMAKLSKGFKSKKQLKRIKKNSINLKIFWQYRGESKETDDTPGQPQQQHDHNYAQDPYSAPTWRQGRRVVELGVLADALSGCSGCRQPLYLSSTQEILTYGLGAILKVRKKVKKYSKCVDLLGGVDEEKVRLQISTKSASTS